jgi:hypothetical protein
VLARLLVEKRLGLEEVSARSPCMGRSARDELVAKVLRGDLAVPERSLEFGRDLVVQPCRLVEGLVAQGGNSGGQGVGTSSLKRA